MWDVSLLLRNYTTDQELYDELEGECRTDSDWLALLLSTSAEQVLSQKLRMGGVILLFRRDYVLQVDRTDQRGIS